MKKDVNIYIRAVILFFLLFTSLLFSQTKRSDLYNSISVFSHNNSDTISVKNIVQKFKNNEFKKKPKFRVYKKLGNKNWWFHIPIKPQNNTKKHQYLTVSNPYLAFGKVYFKKGKIIDSLHTTSYTKSFPFKHIFYRHPVWKIPIDDIDKTDVFLNLKNNGGRSRLEFHLENENEFLKRVETEYIFFGIFIAFILSMLIILLFFSILKKEYSVIFYAIYIGLTLIEFLAGKGLGIQYLWSDSSFLITNIRSFSQTLGTFFIGLFYIRFYKLSKKQHKSEQIFKIGVYITIPFILIYVYKAIFGGFATLFLYTWTILKIIALLWFFNHLYLAIKKSIPFYLMIAFVLPILAIVISQSINPLVNSNDFWFYGSINIYYLMLVAEILLFTRYIFSSVIQTQQKYFKVKKASNELQFNFQNKILEIQQQERNKLLSNVHDSFGGYLEALKIRLLQKQENNPKKVQEILDSFYTEYRYLLNSLYSPKINSENFIENLTEFLNKINQLSSNSINYNFKISNTQLSQSKCVHLYRIISELITNALKYSKASKIKVNINQNINNIELSVIDNGIGFDTTKVNKNTYGLANVKKRVSEMKGEFHISSLKNKGTSITINIPKNE